MKLTLRMASLGFCLAMAGGCAERTPDTFTFTADLPPGFAYEAAVRYVPAPGETCTVGKKDNLAPVFKSKDSPAAEILIRRTRKGCPLVVSRIELELSSIYGPHWLDSSRDSANVVIRDQLEEQYKGSFNEAGESTFRGQCQWLFRTSGRPRVLRKILDCKKTNPQGDVGNDRPFSAYTLDQLPGKTVRMKIRLADDERPYMKDTWVKFPNGWKRCMGDNFEDQYAFCFGNHKDFSGFQMPDGRQCTIYPGCTE
ncbi:hypothetical protein HU762_03575 [Pseudomonas sp. SWRI92]|uniref:hypothetical protein n=1 Tax=Pseudomonas sp. SWRI92 TaxID=2745499 RepID=UPI0016443510|nr:hypothetical protein [Pseudomonas sp. SWRI92]MBC3373013.1 hypothetical protein [Pseudomonas sp. SWRI92]